MTAEHEVRRVVADVITGLLPGVAPADITDDKNLQDLGADSVDRVEIMVELQQRLAAGEPLSTLADVPDIGALITMLAGAAAR
ncbi:acyl carrier protein [Actinoplanes sp. NPDC051475]|uniref:acyl carrier protein n=1 Tax=Actinoplanes sp. NPDC051475 TaxID=3157225 RepID=UPI00344C8320